MCSLPEEHDEERNIKNWELNYIQYIQNKTLETHILPFLEERKLFLSKEILESFSL